MNETLRTVLLVALLAVGIAIVIYVNGQSVVIGS